MTQHDVSLLLGALSLLLPLILCPLNLPSLPTQCPLTGCRPPTIEQIQRNIYSALNKVTIFVMTYRRAVWLWPVRPGLQTDLYRWRFLQPLGTCNCFLPVTWSPCTCKHQLRLLRSASTTCGWHHASQWRNQWGVTHHLSVVYPSQS